MKPYPAEDKGNSLVEFGQPLGGRYVVVHGAHQRRDYFVVIYSKRIAQPIVSQPIELEPLLLEERVRVERSPVATAARASVKSPALSTIKLITGTESTARQTLHSPLPHETPKTTARPSSMEVAS